MHPCDTAIELVINTILSIYIRIYSLVTDLMAHLEDNEVEKLIPISLRVDEHSDYNDDESDQSEMHHPDLELHQCKSNDTYGFPGTQDQHGVRDQNINSSRQYPGSYGWYPQLPPTINIFACPPPPPPYCSNSGQHIFRPTVLPGFGRVQVPQHGFAINVPSNVAQFDDNRNSASGVETPPPPQLTTPFYCDETKTNSQIPVQSNAHFPSQSNNPAFVQSNNFAHSPSLLRRSKATRFHPYQPEACHTRIKKETDSNADKKQHLCVDTQDFNASDISIKLKDKTLTIEGTKPSNINCGRFSSMKHEYTFINKLEAKSTSCTFHSNGTLILQFNFDPDVNQKEASQIGSAT